MRESSDSDIELDQFKQHVIPISDNAEPSDDQAFLQGEPVASATLSWQEKKNMVLLYILYLTHILPLSFSWFTMPILLRQKLSYSVISTLMLSQLPYSVKVAWSPIVQSKHIPLLGRRKTWVVPSFFLGGLLLFWFSSHLDELIDRIAANEAGAVTLFMISSLMLFFIIANLRIALDDWSLTLLSQANIHLAATAATIGEMSGSFFAFQTFLMLSSIEHPNAGTNGEEVSTKLFFVLTAIAFVIMSVFVLFMKQSSTTSHINTSPATSSSPIRSVRASYTIILRIFKLPQVWILILVHMTSMIGFQANDTIAILQLVKSGFTDLDIAALATTALPVEIIGGILISRSFRHQSPLKVWRTLFPYRLTIALVTQVGVLLVTHYRTHHWRWFIALVPYVASKGFEDMMFISLVAFHAQVADPAYGGIYLPLLATSLNVRYDTMGFIATKSIGWIDDRNPDGAGGAVGVRPAEWMIDGYQIVNLCAVVIALPLFWFFLRPATLYLEKTKREDWRVGDGLSGGGKGGAGYHVVSTEDGDAGVGRARAHSA